MSTEARATFTLKPLQPNDLEKNAHALGPAQETGFTSNTGIDVINFRPVTSSAEPVSPSKFPPTLAQESFTSPSHLKGSEALPPLTFLGQQATAYSRYGRQPFPERAPAEQVFGATRTMTLGASQRLRQTNPTEALNVDHPSTFVSTTRTQFNAQPFQDHDSRLVLPVTRGQRYDVGKPVENGYTKNEDRPIAQPILPDLTTAGSVYTQTFPRHQPREMNIAVQGPPAATAFNKTPAHHRTWTIAADNEQILRSVRPEVALRMVKRDPLLVDDPHRHKRRTTVS
eukprot:m.54298 g.54298  ORF g.54298 m.54298 type:complete len:284 (-) comp48719_c0_seq5:96-947(-)